MVERLERGSMLPAARHTAALRNAARIGSVKVAFR